MRTFEFKSSRNGEKETTERLFVDTGDSLFRLTLEVTGELRINKIDKTEEFDHTLKINPSSGNEILIS